MGEVTAAVVGAVTAAVAIPLMGILMSEVSRKLEYCRNLKKNMDTLRKRVEELNQLKTDVESRKRNLGRGRMMKKEVERWLSRVKIINEEVQVVEKLCSAISRSFLAKAWLGKTILGKIDEVKELHRQQGNFSDDIGIDRPSTSEAKLPFINEDVQVVEILCSAGSGCCLTKACLGGTVRRKIDEVKVLCEKGKFFRDNVIDGPSNSGAQPLFFPVEESFNKLKQALDKLNSRKEEVETLKSGRENAGEVVREEVNDWLIDVRSINAVIQILEDAFPRVSPRRIHKLNEIVLEKSHAVKILQQRGTSLMEL